MVYSSLAFLDNSYNPGSGFTIPLGYFSIGEERAQFHYCSFSSDGKSEPRFFSTDQSYFQALMLKGLLDKTGE